MLSEQDLVPSSRQYEPSANISLRRKTRTPLAVLTAKVASSTRQMGLASRSGFKLTADEYVSGNSCLSRAASNPSNPTFTAITRFSVWLTRCTLTLPIPLPSGLAYTPVRVAGHAGFRKVVFSMFLSKSEFFEYAGKDSQSNSGRRVMNFMGAILV